MGGMTPDSFYNSQLFAFLFALGVIAIDRGLELGFVGDGGFDVEPEQGLHIVGLFPRPSWWGVRPGRFTSVRLPAKRRIGGGWGPPLSWRRSN